MGNMRTNLQVITETMVLREKEEMERKRKVVESEIESDCYQSAASGLDFAKIEYPIELEGAIVTVQSIMQFAHENKLLVIEKTKSYVTLSWNMMLRNRIKNLFCKLKIS